jgi:hypothetical protein
MDNARRRRWWILHALCDYPTSAEGLVNVLTSAWKRKSVKLTLGLTALRNDLKHLQEEGLVRLNVVRHTCTGAKVPGRFTVAYITTEGRRKEKRGEYVFVVRGPF